MKAKLNLLFLFLIVGCSAHNEKSNAVSNRNDLTLKEKTTTSKVDAHSVKTIIQNLKELSLLSKSDNYETIKKEIEAERSQLTSKEITLDSISKIFQKSLVNKIIPFWEGTKWTFEGHTSKPKIGSIACGYFVSTTLLDIGLNLNRYKLAQQSPFNEAKSLAVNSTVKMYSEGSASANIAAINQFLKEGIHFIGFDESHVGYILKEKNQLYLIHSNYINAGGVMIEQIEHSEVFKSYNRFYIVELSTNKSLLNSWVHKTPIEILSK